MSYDFYYVINDPELRYAHLTTEFNGWEEKGFDCLAKTNHNEDAFKCGNNREGGYSHCQTQEEYVKYQTLLQSQLEKKNNAQRVAKQLQESMRINRRNRILKPVVITLIALVALAAIAALILFAAPAIVAANGVFAAVFAVGLPSGVIAGASVSAIYKTCRHGLEWVVGR